MNSVSHLASWGRYYIRKYLECQPEKISPNMSDRNRHQQPQKIHHTPSSSDYDADTKTHLSSTKYPVKGKAPVKKVWFTKNYSSNGLNEEIHLPATQKNLSDSVFHPMTPRALPHKAYNILPVIIWGLDEIQPFDIFRLFLTPSLLGTLSIYTNAYASQKREEGSQSSGRAWRNVSGWDWMLARYCGVHGSILY